MHFPTFNQYDVVVIGSGYGASVAAGRMARAGQKVCVLERGIERWPGDFPETFSRAIPEIRVTASVRMQWLRGFVVELGKRTGLYHLVIGKAASVLVGNGFGGTSLINAGVFLRTGSDVLQSTAWPEQLRQPDELPKYYERAEAMFEPMPFPSNLPSPQKYEVLKLQAHSLDMASQCSRVPLTTAFFEYTNASGMKMRASSLAGRDSLGSNDGSKNNTLTTYLADAWTWVPRLRFVRKHPQNGYLVYFRHSGSSESTWSWTPEQQLSWVHAKQFVFLGAGAIGTTEIVLRTREHGFPVSPAVGLGISGNGSLLAFGYNMRCPVKALASSQRRKRTPGTTITGGIDYRDHLARDDRFVIQEGVFPPMIATLCRAVGWLCPAVPPPVTSYIGDCWRSAVHFVNGHDPLEYSQVYLTLGHDNPVGKLSLVGDSLQLDMRGVADSSRLDRVRKTLMHMTHTLRGSFKEPFSKITVHPLGGMNLANDGTGRTGATVHTSEVFAGEGHDVHHDLVVVDGSMVPRSLGINPAATITALAERSVELAATRRGLTVDYDTRRSFEDVWRRHRSIRAPRIVFQEFMKGYLDIAGTQHPVALALHVGVQKARDHFDGIVSGSLDCRKLFKEPLRIQIGRLRLFCEDPSAPNQRTMQYHLKAVSSAGDVYILRGMKYVNPSVTLSPKSLWKASTTLFINMTREGRESAGKGVLRMSPLAFAKQLRTLRVKAPSKTKRAELLQQFLGYFIRVLGSAFLTPFMPLQFPEDGPKEQIAPWLGRPVPNIVKTITASDGVQSMLRMWKPTSSCASMPLDLLFVPGAAVSHGIFALSTIQKNAIEYFTDAGYCCWCVSTRMAKSEVTQQEPWTAHDARLDIAAALDEIERYREQKSSRSRPYVIAHCAGAIALACGLLDGSIPSNDIGGITASNVFLHPDFGPLNQLKARLNLLPVYRLVAGPWFSCASSRRDHGIQYLLNMLLRFYPQSRSREICNSNVCHRSQLAFGRLWSHQNLNDQTHASLHEILGGISVKGLHHFIAMGSRSEVTDDDGNGLVGDCNLERLKDIPIFIFSGGENAVYSPEATSRSYELLLARFGKGNVRRHVCEGFGHLDCWMSEKSTVVFEMTEAEIDRVSR